MIDPLLIPIAGISLPVILVPTVMGLRQARRERELEHAERMRALELGRTLPSDESWWTLPRIIVAIGAGVPAVVFFCAWQASGTLEDPALAWVSAGIVGVTAVLRSSFLAARYYLQPDERVRAGHDFEGKSGIDADAYDVVSSRG